MRRVILPVVLVLSLGLAGCTSAQPSGSPTPDPSVTVTDPSSSPVADETEVIDLETAYEMCKDKTLEQLADGDVANVDWAPFDDAFVLERDDEVQAVYFEVFDGNNQNPGRTAISCKVRGTLASPEWLEFGVSSWEEDPAEIERQLMTDAQP